MNFIISKASLELLFFVGGWLSLLHSFVLAFLAFGFSVSIVNTNGAFCWCLAAKAAAKKKKKMMLTL